MSALTKWCLFVCLTLVPVSGAAQSLDIGSIHGSRGAWVQRTLTNRLRSAGVEISDASEYRLAGRISGSRWRAYVLRLRLTGPDATRQIVVRRRNPSRLVNGAVDLVRQRLAEDARQAALESHPPEPPVEAVRAVPEAAQPSAAGSPSGAPMNQRVETEATVEAERRPPAPAIEFRAGLDWVTRTLDFRDDVFDRLGTYSLPAAPMVNLGGRWFPGMHLTSHPLAGVGIDFTFQTAFGVSADMSDGSSTMATSIDEFGLGLLYRVQPIERLTVEVGFGYGEARLQVDPDGPESEQHLVPPVHYRFLRPTLAAEFALGEGVSIRAAGGWRSVVDSGPLSDEAWFPRSNTTGVDVLLGVRWQFNRYVAVSVHAQHIRYLTDIAPEPGDRLVAGGAADEWTRAGAELTVIIPGTGSP